jgi:ribosomal-protein-alanine N-acetyltransferase
MIQPENSNAYHIRRMSEGDIPQVLEVDMDAFPDQWPHPTPNSFHHELRNKLAHYMVIGRGGAARAGGNGHRVIGLKEGLLFLKQLFSRDRFFGPAGLLTTGEQLVGMAGIWMMVDEAHIVTIAVRKSHRHRGLGEWLLIGIIDLSTQLRAKYVTLEVRASNSTAQALYEKYGFTKAGTRIKYYSDNGEDALIMTTCELDSPSYLERLQRLKQEHNARWRLFPAWK